MPSTEKRTSLRLPDDMRERVERLAVRDRRSVHAELLWLIEKGLQQEEK